MNPTPVSSRPWIRPAGSAGWTSPPPPPQPAAFHRSLPGYAPTPLHEVPELAAHWGVRRVMVKDESARLGLPAFKALGVFYAVYRVVQDVSAPPLVTADLASLQAAAAGLPGLELVTATDGNHGHALARVGRLLGLPVRVFIPDVVDPAEIAAVRAEGADVVVGAQDYDGTVARAAADAASRTGAVLVQDTAWAGYETIPQYIVDGYSTMFAEIDRQLHTDQADVVVTPIGVGSLAHAVLTHYKSRGRPVAVLGVEPDTAACVTASLRAGRTVSVPTATTIMAGLNCGTPSALAWPALRDGLDGVAVVTDRAAADAAEHLAELGIPAGPCGAACVPGVRAVLAEPGARDALGVTAESVVVLLSTEKSRTGGPRAER